MSENQSKKTIQPRWFLGIQIVMMAFWASQLLYSEAYYVDYLLLVVLAVICCFFNTDGKTGLPDEKIGKTENILVFLFAILFSGMVTLANYDIWKDHVSDFGYTFDSCYHVFSAGMLFFGGFFAFRHIFSALSLNIRKLTWKLSEKQTVKPKTVFLICFLLLVLSRSIVLFFCKYPGILSNDSIDQIGQTISGTYSNHQPFYHTLIIRGFMLLGMKLFRDINAAVAVYSLFQLLFTAFCFSFTVSTIARMRAPGWLILACTLFFLLMPYHIVYAVTMWKDVFWAGFILLLITVFYRCTAGIGNHNLNILLLAVSGLGVCLSRSNGLFVFCLLTGAMLILWRFQNRKQLLLFVLIIVVSVILKYPVLKKLQVEQPDIVESLSIPAQQIARVVCEGCELTDWEKAALSAVIDIERIPEAYQKHISDPVKYLVREKGCQVLIRENRADYLKLYLSLGLRYPRVYLRAWIDQTKGYWNAGYDYWRWKHGISANDFEIVRTVRCEWLHNCLEEYLWLFPELQILRPFLSIGLFVWLDLMMLFVSLIRKDKLGIFLSLPILTAVLSLLVATPVASEFRYMYSAFCALPMVMTVALRPTLPTPGL